MDILHLKISTNVKHFAGSTTCPKCDEISKRKLRIVDSFFVPYKTSIVLITRLVVCGNSVRFLNHLSPTIIEDHVSQIITHNMTIIMAFVSRVSSEMKAQVWAAQGGHW